ncbi:Zn-dependent protease [Conexibacter sp. W3-3-2]|uniref:Zn-dependent protease n=1 Tax=Paraconexibacter algicola TaxID=2133960 RepID=A0A2T4UIE3_9ACTN|nr:MULTISPECIES: zinc metallopeptidase [Solirubrobacterales]MTD45316.1 Zn-dependent protease [Conexibacter sp. W3-3-2]PTL59011.1 Zn-dependent protease [Paraconexibacter algicola]
MDGIVMYLVFLVPALVLGLAAQWWLKRTFATNSEIGVQSGMTGEEVARRILDANGLHGVPVHPSPGGPLSDHYDPRSRGVFLSEPVFAGRSIAAAAVAAHEVGHAIQHDKAYAPMQVRSALFPAVAFASSTWIFLLLAGAFMNAIGLIQVAIALYAVAVLFHFVTLPVEFDASRRAQVQLAGMGLVTDVERSGTRKVLTAAAMTYVVGAIAALSQLIYFVLAYLQD